MANRKIPADDAATRKAAAAKGAAAKGAAGKGASASPVKVPAAGARGKIKETVKKAPLAARGCGCGCPQDVKPAKAGKPVKSAVQASQAQAQAQSQAQSKILAAGSEPGKGNGAAKGNGAGKTNGSGTGAPAFIKRENRGLKQIAIYGKGGIGKSTTTSNLSAALADMGYKVMQFGCDPKADSTNTLRDGSYIPTILDLLREKGRVEPRDAIFEGYNGIYCVEAGGPSPGVGCAGRGIITAVQLLKQQNIYEELGLDYVIYDVLGDVVCGGFAVPIREGIAKHVFTVSSSDFMSIYSANNRFRGIQK
jgi:hypothetical protein